MSGMSFDGVKNDVFEAIRTESAFYGQNPAENIFRYQRDFLVNTEKRADKAAFLDVFEHMDKDSALSVIDMLNMGNISSTAGKSQLKGKGDYFNRNTYIAHRLKQTLPSIMDKRSRIGWHHQLVSNISTRLHLGNNEDGKIYSLEGSVDRALEMLYGNFAILDNDAGVNVAFKKNDLQYANVGQNEWDESLHYMFMNLFKKYKGKVSFVPREDVIQELGDQAQLANTVERPAYKKPNNIEFDPTSRAHDNAFDVRAMGMNKYNNIWNILHNDIVKQKGGNIFPARINDPNDPTKIRMVLARKNRDGNVKIIGDIFGIESDPSSLDHGKSVAASFTMDNAIKMMQARQAWQHANSQDDVLPGSLDINYVGGAWDGWDGITGIARLLERKIRGITGTEFTESDPSAFGGMESGGDFSREEFKGLYEKFSRAAWEKEKGREYTRGDNSHSWLLSGDGYAGLRANSFGGKFLTEIASPGKAEMDLFYQPLWEEIMIHEEQLGREVTDTELYDIFQIVKNRLNGKENFWDNNVTDLLFEGGQSDIDKPSSQTGTPRTLFEAYVVNGGDMLLDYDGVPKGSLEETWEKYSTPMKWQARASYSVGKLLKNFMQ